MLPMNESRDFVERMVPLWHGLFFGTLAVCASIALLLERELALPQKIFVLLLSLAFAAWHYALNVRLPMPRRRPRLMLLYVSGATIFTFALINLHPIYWLMVFTLFGITFGVLPLRWAIAASVGITAAMAWQSFLARGITTENLIAAIVLSCASIGFGAFFGWFIDRIINESATRRRLIEELNATRAALAQREREAGILQERQRLAREIHDTLAQGFTSIVMQLEAAEQALQTEPASAQKFLDTARQTARTSLDEARRVVADLRPELLEQASLPDALKRTAERWAHVHGIVVHTNVSGEIIPLAPELEITLLRATQETLNNIAKHAHASHVELSLAYLGDVVTLDIQDNGVGMNANGNHTNAASGFGLVALRERVEQLGGQVTIESAKSEGTTIAVEIPIVVELEKRQATQTN